jgi:site-specific DNA recombinase
MIHTMLLNPAYAGQAVYGRRRCVPWQAPLHPPRGHDRLPRRPFRQVRAPVEQHIGVPVPAIIDATLFASAAERLEENRKRNRERLAGVRYLLRGLLVCQKCGYGFSGHHHRGQLRYYRCCGTDRSRYQGERRCDARMIAVEPLDDAVWAEVRRLLEDPARVLEEYQRRVDAAQASPRRLERDALSRRLTKARGAIGRLIDSYAEGLIEKTSSSHVSPNCAGARHDSRPKPARCRSRRNKHTLSNSLSVSLAALRRWCGIAWKRWIGSCSAISSALLSNVSRCRTMLSGWYSASIRARQVHSSRAAFCHIVQLVVVLHRMWVSDTEFRYSTREAAKEG